MINNALLAVDNFENSRNALNYMRHLQGCIANVIVLTVVDNTFALSRTGLRSDSDELNEYPAAQYEEQLAEAQINRVVQSLHEMGYSAQGLMAAGTPMEVIPEQMALFNCELLIISHRHLSSLGRLLNTSVTRSLLEDMLQPVLVIPRKSQ